MGLADLLRDCTSALNRAPRFPLASIKNRDAFRDAIDSTVDLLASLKTCRNQVSAISFLPDDLLSGIFHRIMLEDPWSTEWARVIKVCRRWHTVAMDHARLWSWISQDSLGSSARAILRKEALSKGAPLALFAITIIGSYSKRTHIAQSSSSSKAPVPNSGILSITSNTCRLSPPCRYSRITMNPVEAKEKPGICLCFCSKEEPRACLDFASTVSVLGTLITLNISITIPIWSSPWREYIASSFPSRVLRPRPALSSPAASQNPTLHRPYQGGAGQISSLIRHPLVLTLPEVHRASRFRPACHRHLIIPPITTFHLHIPCCQSSAYHPSHIRSTSESHDGAIRHHTVRNPTIPTLRAAVLDCSRYLSFSFSHQEPCPDPFVGMSPPELEKADIHIQTWPRSQHEIRQILTQIVNFLPLEQLRSIGALRIMSKDLDRRIGLEADPTMSMQTWRTLFRLLPSDLAITIGVNDGMVVLLEAILNTMQTSSQAQHKTRRQKNQRRDIGLGSRPLSSLVL
ncbi:hypothetical protein BDV98DRAFT_315057 [Pterulicium gracile]|uniref:F-box domain-containing protein n=1 Tax=Pterulicium gracile TaxID=1884261 RepID=A0A5C3QVI9_9AGAR|nr:hypothetical protein BDV98DRAFT_315057 [Pterula gracilis]